MRKKRDPREPLNQYGRDLDMAAASWRLSRRYAASDREDADECQEDIDTNDLGSERAARAMRIENYHRRRR